MRICPSARAAAGWLVSPPRLSRETALRSSERLAALTAITASLEYLAGGSAARPGRLNDPAHNLGYVSPRVRPLLAAASTPIGLRLVQCSRIAAGLALMLPTPRRARLAANMVLGGATMITLWTESHGTDGSDQVALLSHTALALGRARGSDAVADASLWFLALQSGLSYLASGAAKAISDSWLSGAALPNIFRTYSYGHAPTWRLLSQHPELSKWLSRSAVAFECALPLTLLWRRRLARIYVGASAAFHLANGYTMGLGRFTMAFASFHPSVLYVSRPMSAVPAEARRSDVLPRLAAVLGAATWLASAAGALLDRRLIRGLLPEDRTLRTSAGNTLRYRVAGQRTAGQPTLVFEGGLGEPDMYWTLLEAELSGRFQTVAYARAGYGRSRWGGAARPAAADPDVSDLDVSRADLAELIACVANPQDGVVVVGHSLGGYLSLTPTASVRRALRGLVLLDPSHAGRSEELRGTLPVQQRGLTLIHASLRAGLGRLLRTPAELGDLPPGPRRRAAAEYRDPGTWSAMQREFDAAVAEWDRVAEPVAPDVPLVVLTAEHTAQLDATQLALDRQLVAGRPASSHHIVPGTNHVGLLAIRGGAVQVAARIAGLMDALTGRETANAAGDAAAPAEARP